MDSIEIGGWSLLSITTTLPSNPTPPLLPVYLTTAAALCNCLTVSTSSIVDPEVAQLHYIDPL